MKKIALIIIVLLAVNTITNAQKLRYGVRAGVNTSNLELTGMQIGGMNDFDGESKSGLVIGGFAEYKIKFLGLAAELQYSEQGAKFCTGFNEEGIGNKQIDLNYLSLSPIAKLYVFKWLNLQLGWHTNYNISGNNYMTAIVSEWVEGTSTYENKLHHYKLRKWNHGILTGIEACIHDHICLTYRGYLLNSNIVDTNVDGLDMNNHVSQFSIAYKF